MGLKTLKLENIKTNKSNLFCDNRGVAALLTIVIISAAVLIMALSSAILGLGELDMGWTSQKGGETFALVDGCLEEVLRQLQLDNNYNGGTLSFVGNSCIISVVSNGNNRIINVSGTVSDYTKKIEANIDIDGILITLNSWKEV